MNRIEVTTKEALKIAQEQGIDEITVMGELAEKLKKAKKITTLNKVGLGLLMATLGAATVTAPMTGGLSYYAAASVAALTGVEIATIITAASLGIAMIIAVFKGYDVIVDGPGRLILKKKDR